MLGKDYFVSGFSTSFKGHLIIKGQHSYSSLKNKDQQKKKKNQAKLRLEITRL